MYQLFWIIIALIVVLLLSYYCFHVFSHSKKVKPLSQVKPLPLGKSSFREMASLLETNQKESAQLVLSQLQHYPIQGRDAVDLLALNAKVHFIVKDFESCLDFLLRLSQSAHLGCFMGEIDFIQYLGHTYLALDRLEEAYKEFVFLTQKDPGNVTALHQAGSLALQLDEVSTAIGLFDKALKIQASHVPSLIKIGRIFFEKQMYVVAVENLNTAYCMEHAHSNELDYFFALSLLQVGSEYSLPLSLLTSVSQSPEWRVLALPHMARIYNKVANWEGVIQSVEKYDIFMDQDVSLDLKDEMVMLKAHAYQNLHQFLAACELWKQIATGSAFYARAEEERERYLPFCSEGLLKDYVESSFSQFLQLCTNLYCWASEEKLRQVLKFDSYPLKLYAASNNGQRTPSSVVIVQHAQEYVDPKKKVSTFLETNLFIYLRLSQNFTQWDLVENIKAYCSKNTTETMTVFIYSLHYLPLSGFVSNLRYNIQIQPASVLREKLMQLQLSINCTV